MRNVVASLRDSGQIPAEWGWREKVLNSASAKSNNSGGLLMQLSIGAFASVFLAVATLFAMLSFGLYV